MAFQPKKRLTRSTMTSEVCWISSTIGPSTRSTKVAGSGGCPSTGRGHWIFSGSEWAATFAPAMGRIVEGHELAAVVRFLASDAASAVTGQTINVDGGIVVS